MKTSGMERIRVFCRHNPIFTIFLALQAAAILLLAGTLFQTPANVTLTPEDFGVDEALLDGNRITFGRFDTSDETVEINVGRFVPHAGAYRLEIDYQSSKENDLQKKSLFEEAGYCSAASAINPSAVRMDTFCMDYGHDTISERLWLSFGPVPEDLTLTFTAIQAKLSISGIRLTEQVIWRWTRLIGVLLLLLALDGAYLLFFSNGCPRMADRAAKGKTAIALFAIVFLSSLPLFTDFLFDGHDLSFHAQRIVSIAQEQANGQFPVRMNSGMLNTYGYVTSLYYCDLLLYPFAALYNCMVPLYQCYQLYYLFINALTAIVSYYCFREMCKSRKMGLLGAALYTLSAYRLTNLYIRAAMGELTAMTFFPLVAYGMYAIYRAEKPDHRQWLLLGVGMAGVIQSHVISTELAMIFLALVCLLYARKTFTWVRMKALALATVTAVALSLWYLLPLVHTMLSTPVGVNATNGKIQVEGTYLVQLLGILLPGVGSSKEWGVLGEMPMGVGLCLVIGMGLAIYCCVMRRQWSLEKDDDFKRMKNLFLLSCFGMLLSSRAFPWDSLEGIVGQKLAKLVTVIQYPWRYLTVVNLLLTLVALLSLALLKRQNAQRAKQAACVMLCALTLVTGNIYLQFTNEASEYHYYSANYRQSMSAGLWDYVLADTDVLQSKFIYTEPSDPSVTVEKYEKRSGTAYVACQNAGTEEGSVTLPLWCYANYRAYEEETGEERAVDRGNNGRVRVSVAPGYRGTIAVRYAPPMLWRVAEGISLAALAWILLLLWKDRKAARKAGIGA